MEELIEVVLELLLEGGMELSANKKVSKWIRYPIIVFLLLFFTFAVFGIFILGIMLIEDSIIASLLLIACSTALLFGGIIKIKKIYLEHKTDSKEDK